MGERERPQLLYNYTLCQIEIHTVIDYYADVCCVENELFGGQFGPSFGLGWCV